MALNRNMDEAETMNRQSEIVESRTDETVSVSVQEGGTVTEQENEKPTELPESQRMGVTEIDGIVQNMLEKVSSAWRDEEMFILRHSNNTDSFLQGIKEAPLKQFQPPEVVIGFLSGVSGGKSSFLNTAICRYPISPVAATTTSICAVETRRVNSLSDERIEVCLLTEKKSAFQKKPVCTFKKQVFSEVIFNKLVDYAMFLVDQDILNVKDTLAFFRDKDGRITLSRSDWRHCMVLLMIVLDAYVYQDQQNNPALKANYKAANVMRNELLRMLEVPSNTDYGLRLYWNSDSIPSNAVLVDLPGTGAATNETEDQIGHTKLVSNYLTLASSVICFFDEKATMGSETKELLDTFIHTSELKGSSSARLTFVLHKADIIETASDSPEEADKSIRTAINGFRQSFSSSADYSIYALSSWDGEWPLQDSGIPLRNLHHTAKFTADYRRFSRRDPSVQEMRDYQLERFQRTYPYQADACSDFEKTDYATFTNTLLSEYVCRMQFLLSVECFKEHMVSVQTVADAISAEKAMYHIAHDYSPELAGIISSTIQDALVDEIDELIGKFQDLNSAMKTAVSQASERLNAIVDQFDKDYSVLNGDINKKLQNRIAQLEKKDGKIPVDGNLIGTNEQGIRNRERIIALSEDISQINFIGYFNKAFRHLNDEFDLERSLYNDSISQISDLVLDFPNQVIRRMTEAFSSALEEKKLQTVQGFQTAFEIAKESTECLLVTVCKNYVDKLQADTGVNDVLLDTANRIQSDLMDLLAPYVSGNYGAQVLNRISKHRFFRANVIDEAALKDLLTKYYISDFKDKMDKTLLEDIEGKNQVDEAHSFRMSEAISQLERNHLSKQTTEQLRNQVKSACDVTDKIIGDPQRLSTWKNALDKAAEELQQFFGNDTVYSFFGEISPKFADSNWAMDSLSIAGDAADAAKKHADALLFEESEGGQGA